MQRSQWVFAVIMVVVAAAPLAAQQSLGDVAGSFKLNRPEGEPVVIDHNTVRSASPTRAGTADVAFFRDTVDDCISQTRTLYGLVAEARDGTSFYREGWRSRVAQTGFQLDDARNGLDLVRVGSRYMDAFVTAERGSTAAGEALEIMRSAIADDRPVFSEAGTRAMEAVRLFEDAQAAIGTASRADAVEGTPVLINPIDADRDISTLCRRRYGDDSSGFTRCAAEQRSALDALTGRSGPSVGLTVVDFNVIRNNCRSEWPGDYANQDQCERRHIAATRSP